VLTKTARDLSSTNARTCSAVCAKPSSRRNEYSRTFSPKVRASTGTAGYTGFGNTMEPPSPAKKQMSAINASEAPVMTSTCSGSTPCSVAIRSRSSLPPCGGA
jgi:hypothetical protein